MIGVTSLADADRYQINSAALQTTNANTFVAPERRLDAGGDRRSSSRTRRPAPGRCRDDSWARRKKAAAAYPGTMVVYAAVPTTGLPHDRRQGLRRRCCASRPARVRRPGLGVGELPPGYLPLTKANGLGELAGYTWRPPTTSRRRRARCRRSPATRRPAHADADTDPDDDTRRSPARRTRTRVRRPSRCRRSPPAAGSSLAGRTQPTVASSPPPTHGRSRSAARSGIGLGGGGLVVVLVLGTRPAWLDRGARRHTSSDASEGCGERRSAGRDDVVALDGAAGPAAAARRAGGPMPAGRADRVLQHRRAECDRGLPGRLRAGLQRACRSSAASTSSTRRSAACSRRRARSRPGSAA